VTDDPKRAILARRARFVAAAIAGVTVSACGGQTTDPSPQPCLEPSIDAGDAADDSAPEPCLGMPAPDAEPEPCLSAPAPDAEPAPCLDVEPPDAGDAGG
jgi:hypothetical protein